VGIYDEPYADSSAIPTYRVCQLARKHVTVALSGDGGDENFIGYRRYRLFAMEEAVRSRVPAGVRRAMFGPLGRWYPKLDWAPRFVRGKTTFQALARGTVDAYLHGVSICSQEMRADLYSPAFRRELQGYDASEVFHGHARGVLRRPLPLAPGLQTYLPRHPHQVMRQHGA
jgi:asparagine synthase (glutamine-hydrolysing)